MSTSFLMQNPRRWLSLVNRCLSVPSDDDSDSADVDVTTEAIYLSVVTWDTAPILYWVIQMEKRPVVQLFITSQ